MKLNFNLRPALVYKKVYKDTRNTVFIKKMTIDQEFFDLLNASFTTEEEQRFSKHFSLYAGYGKNKKDFVIDLDEVWQWMGFVNKKNSKNLLMKRFVLDKDYILLDTNVKQNGSGGHNRKQIFLNIDTFKNMCMLSNSVKGKETRTYYIKMEEVFFEHLIKKHENIVDSLKKENAKKIAIERHQHLKQAYQNKPCVYILRLEYDEMLEERYIVKIGETDDIKTRITSLRQEYKNCLLLDVFPCPKPHTFEQYLFKREDISRQRVLGSELIVISKSFTYKMLLKIIEKNIDFFDLDTIDQRIAFMKQKLNTDYMNHKIRLMEQIMKAEDVETKKGYEHILETLEADFKRNQEELRLELEKEETPIEYKEPASDRTVYKYAIDDLQTPVAKYASLREAARSLNDSKVYDYHIRNAFLLNTEVNGFRWYCVDQDESGKDAELPREIPETVELSVAITSQQNKPRKNGLIAEIDETSKKIVNVFASMKEISERYNVADCTISIAIQKNRLCKGRRFRMYDECEDELKQTFTGVLPERRAKTCNKKVEQIDPNTNKVLRVFDTIQQVCHEFRICHKKINQLSESGDIYKNYKWRLVT